MCWTGGLWPGPSVRDNNKVARALESGGGGWGGGGSGEGGGPIHFETF